MEGLPTGSGSSAATYSPLSKDRREIRILHIEGLRRVSKRRRRLVVCRLESVSLLDQPPREYAAVSWCWGNTTKQEEIILNGRIFRITKNAEEVLRHLCYKHGYRIVWMDAVCINQSDLDERGHQVGMMHDVYSMAAKTLVWLGFDDGCAERALKTLDIMYQHCMDNTSGEVDEAFWDNQGLALSSTLQLPHCDWWALEKFFAAKWFRRLWAVQEVLLSKDAICYRGDHSWPWSRIGLATQWMYHRSYYKMEHGVRSISGLNSAADVWRIGRRQVNLVNLLETSIYKDATERLDKVYGLLGLMQNMNPGKDIAHELAPDYNANAMDVYRDATKQAILALSGDPDQLSLLRFSQALVSPSEEYAERDHEYERRRPSWVPRFDWHFSTSSPAFIRPTGNGAAHGIGGNLRFACDDRDLLTAEGVLLGQVRSAGSPLTREIYNWSMTPLPAEMVQGWSLAKRLGRTENDLLRTLLCGQVRNRQELDRTMLQNLDFAPFVCGCIEVTGQKDKAICSVSECLHCHYKATRDAIWHNATNRRFFITKNGYMGMGPPGMVVGDIAVILFGSDFPLILRPHGRRWTLVGTAYVHQIMGGEYIRELKAEGRFEEEKRFFDIV